MNWARINTFLLIAVIIGIAIVLYFLFNNKKDNARQNDALAIIMKKLFGGEIPREHIVQPPAEQKKEEMLAEPTEKDWEMIYAISEKIYFHIPRTDFEKNFQKKFDKYIQADIEYCNEFYPIADKMVAGTELNSHEKEFYEVNKEDVDDEVNHRIIKAIAGKLVKEEALDDSQKSFYEANKEEINAEVTRLKGKGNSKLQNIVTPIISPDLTKSSPPLEIEKRNKTILSFFEDGIPKAVPKISELFKTATGHDYAKNIYRVMGQLEGKFLTPYKHGKITYYCLPEWFDGRKLKQEFKNKIA